MQDSARYSELSSTIKHSCVGNAAKCRVSRCARVAEDRGTEGCGCRATPAGRRCWTCSWSGAAGCRAGRGRAGGVGRDDPARLRPARRAADAGTHPGRRGGARGVVRTAAALQDRPARPGEAAHREGGGRSRRARRSGGSDRRYDHHRGGPRTGRTPRSRLGVARADRGDERAQHRQRAGGAPSVQDRTDRRGGPPAVLRAGRPSRTVCSARSPSTSPSSVWSPRRDARGGRPRRGRGRRQPAVVRACRARDRRRRLQQAGRRAFARICAAESVDTLVTDAAVPEETVRRFEEVGIAVVAV